MSRRTLVFDPEAVEEAERSRDWYHERSPRAAANFLAELSHAFEQIARAPERWPSYIHGTRRYVFDRYPFYVVYKVFEERIYIVAVAHGRRRPGYWKARK